MLGDRTMFYSYLKDEMGVFLLLGDKPEGIFFYYYGLGSWILRQVVMEQAGSWLLTTLLSLILYRYAL